ncbi:hypothetical protein Poli38472_009428 [Pythium oligandrum]|uniref:COMM domain-containing protein n=1 Tax=Pythium oligandrum TaxID=41045 RepID=A0A8K1CM92_PYTOL|nr:hypothetical protein Poli38472_009428 [Pythium oligandrum]|eukprot:TMW65261.1 hypothetical protein Poli38472_009428 [Pythium oligandrum]
MTMTPHELTDFDYSVRMTLASSTLCEQRTSSVVLKLHLADLAASERQVVLELDEAQLATLLKQLAVVRKELRKESP